MSGSFRKQFANVELVTAPAFWRASGDCYEHRHVACHYSGINSQTMMSQYEVPDYLERQLPELKKSLHHENIESTYSAIQVLLDHTSENMDAHNYRAVKKCFAVADDLYSRGNNRIKNAVTNVFVYSLSRLFHDHEPERKYLLGLIPITLYTLYIQQQNCAGC